MKKFFALFGIKNKNDFWAFVKQFFKFGIVGLSNTAMFLGIYYLMLFFGLHYLLANLVAFIISVLNAFFWNRKFVFKSKKSVPMQLLRVYAAYGITFTLSTFTLFLMVDILQISEFIAPLVNICITVPLNFLINKFWAFG